MSSEMYVYQIPKKDLEKNDYLLKQFKDNSLDSVDLTLGDAEGFKLVWISPRLGNLWDGLVKHVPGLRTSAAFQLTKEQVVGILEISRDVAEKDKGEFQDPRFFDYLLAEFNQFETLATEFDFENNYLFAYTN